MFACVFVVCVLVFAHVCVGWVVLFCCFMVLGFWFVCIACLLVFCVCLFVCRLDWSFRGLLFVLCVRAVGLVCFVVLRCVGFVVVDLF